METLVIRLMTQETAQTIADTWHYTGKYAFYDAASDEEDYEELITPEKRKENYYECLAEGQLMGFFCIEKDGDTVQLGLGLLPELTGRGIGQGFMNRIEAYIKEKFPDVTGIGLAVVSFNQRAYKVYKKCGFHETGKARMQSNGGMYTFITMYKKIVP